MKKDLFKTLDQETEEKLLQQVRMEVSIKAATELLKLNIDINDIIKATKLTKQEIQTLQQQILGK